MQSVSSNFHLLTDGKLFARRAHHSLFTCVAPDCVGSLL